ncbi:MAG: archease [Thiohalophilus sp.]
MSNQAAWEHFEHGADIGVRGFGGSAAEAFEQAALALTAVITDPGKVIPAKRVRIDCQAPDIELLFADWLNALVYEMAVRRMLFCRFEVAIDDQSLKATAWGEAIDNKRHHPAVEVKGATYTGLQVTVDKDGLWRAQCIVDV